MADEYTPVTRYYPEIVSVDEILHDMFHDMGGKVTPEVEAEAKKIREMILLDPEKKEPSCS